MTSGRFWRPFIALAALVAALASLASTGRPAMTTPAFAAGSEGFEAVPCPNIQWRYSDPSFSALRGAKAFFGRYEGGLYRVEIPDNWNGELVLIAHGFTTTAGPTGDLLQVGFDGQGVSLVVAPGLEQGFRDHLIEKGYAWAASSYRCNGYIPGIGLQDTILLKDVFRSVSGGRVPARTYLSGISMGGHITILGAHQFPQVFDGYLAFCAAGPELFDFFMATGAAAEVVTGLRFESTTTVASTTARMLEITGPYTNLTEKGRQLASIQINISGGPRPFALEGLASYFASNISGSALAGGTSSSNLAVTNTHIQYGIDPGLGLSADDINRTVRRKAADASFRGETGPFDELKPFDGNIQKPLLTYHTTGDLFVPIFLEQVLKRAVDRSGKSDLLVQRAVRNAGHCTFSVQEINQAYDDLFQWVRYAQRPAGENLLGDLANAGRQFTNPIRPGDPGTLRVTASAAAAPPPVRPPSTGDGGLVAQQGARTPALALGKFVPSTVISVLMLGILRQQRVGLRRQAGHPKQPRPR